MLYLTPFYLFRTYHAVFLHYNSSYDYQKNLGYTRCTEERFEARKDKKDWYELRYQVINFNNKSYEYYLAWLFYKNYKWVTVKNIVENEVRYRLEWMNYSKRRLALFKIDLIKLYRNHSPTHIFQLLNLGDMHYATILILNRYTNIIDRMNKELQGNLLWDSKFKKLVKFEPFYNAHEPFEGSIFKQHIPETLYAS